VTVAQHFPISNEELVSMYIKRISLSLNFDFGKKCIKRFVKINGILEQSIGDWFPVPIVYKKQCIGKNIHKECIYALGTWGNLILKKINQSQKD
jgi:hypothetical protein